MNRELRTRLDLLRPGCEKSVLDRQAVQKSSHDRRANVREFVVGDRVFARNLRPGPEWVPSTILEVLGPVTYIVETDEGLRWKRHADQLKHWVPHSPETTGREFGNVRETDDDEFVVDPPSDSNGTDPPQVVDPHEDESESGAEVGSPPADGSSQPRYPQRDRHPPERYA